MFDGCHNVVRARVQGARSGEASHQTTISQWAWPDGGPWLEQPQIVDVVFRTIEDERRLRGI